MAKQLHRMLPKDERIIKGYHFSKIGYNNATGYLKTLGLSGAVLSYQTMAISLDNIFHCILDYHDCDVRDTEPISVLLREFRKIYSTFMYNDCIYKDRARIDYWRHHVVYDRNPVYEDELFERTITYYVELENILIHLGVEKWEGTKIGA